MRAAVYARYSSDLQDATSIEDQARLCRQFAEKRGDTVVGLYADRALSGAHLRSRPDAMRLLEDARVGRFDLVVAEALDRLSRDQEDLAGIYKRLRFAGVALVTLAEGAIDELHVGLKGTMNALFLRDLAAKIRRGQSGRTLKGFSAGGLAYGYEVVHRMDADGEPVRGLRRVKEAEAAVIRRIFEAYARGLSGRKIAAMLNAEGVPSPQGGHWVASCINGNQARGIGILWNDAYRGRLVWNRLRMVKDPETGRRLSRVNDPSEHITVDAPNLRIVSDELWAACQGVKARFSTAGGTIQRRPRRLFSGLLRCAACGGAYTVKSGIYLSCSTHRESGVCTNGRTIAAPALERRVLGGLRERLLAPDLVAAFVAEYHAERDRLAHEAERRRSDTAKRLAGLDAQIGRVVDAIAEGLATPAMKARLASLEAERAQAAAAATDEALARRAVTKLRPEAAGEWRNLVDGLTAGKFEALDETDRIEATAALRRLVEGITIYPGPRRGEFRIEAVGRLDAILAPPYAMSTVAEAGFGHGRGFVKISC